MRVVAAHHRDGTIASFVVCPPDAPPLAGMGELDHHVTELDVAEDVLESIRQEGDLDERRSIEALNDFRVDVRSEGKLVRKSGSA